MRWLSMHKLKLDLMIHYVFSRSFCLLMLQVPLTLHSIVFSFDFVVQRPSSIIAVVLWWLNLLLVVNSISLTIILIILCRRHKNHIISSWLLIRFQSNFNCGMYAKISKIQWCDCRSHRGHFRGIQHLVVGHSSGTEAGSRLTELCIN